MRTKSKKGIKGIITLSIAFALCVAVLLFTTFGALSDSKTATGTITFDLADYDFQVTNASTSVSGIYPGGNAVTTNATNLINTNKTREDKTTGATAGMVGVYVKIEFTSIKIGGETFSDSLTLADRTNSISVSATTEHGYLDIELIKSAGTNIYWGIVNGSVYLVNTSGKQTTLAFSKSTDTTKTTATIQFNITGQSPTGVTNGFNASTGTTVGLPNKYQGKQVSILYTIKWGTTTSNIGGGGN